jgi:lipopolysaccharide/colanic/teichoic acid biosynthesis glycosyltransferase
MTLQVKTAVMCVVESEGQGDASIEHWMELDFQYIDNRSPKLDFEILMKTIPAGAARFRGELI